VSNHVSLFCRTVYTTVPSYYDIPTLVIIIIIIITRNKSNACFEATQYRQDVFPIAHYYNGKNFPTYNTRCSENQSENTCAENRKIRDLKFDTLYWRHLAAQRKIWLWVHNYKSSCIKSPQNIFVELHGLIDFRCAQTSGLPCAFGYTTVTNLKVFRGTL